MPLRFGPFLLEPDGCLRRGRNTIPLAPKELALLRMLSEARGRLVSKQDILDRIWPGDDVGEASITRCVRGLRKALGEGGRRGGTIETEHGRGYRIATPVQSCEEPETSAGASHRPLRIGVGPFDDVSPARSNEFLARGISGAVTDSLVRGRARALTVIARQSAQRLQKGSARLFTLSRELRLDFVVTGWLQAEGEEIIVRVELARTSDEALAWCEEFRRPRRLVSQLADEIAESVAKELGRLRTERTSVPAERHAPSSKSYLALLQGQFAAQLRTERGIRRGIELFEQAIAWDPRNAEACVARADALLFLGLRGYAAPIEIAPGVRESVTHALDLGPRLASAYASLAYLRSSIDYDPRAALRAIDRGTAFEPGNPRLEWMRGQVHLAQGRFDEALDAYRASIDLDPFSPSTTAAVVFALFCAQRLEEAAAAARALAEREPEFALGHGMRAGIAALMGRRREAIRSAETAEYLARGDQLTLGACAWALGVAGRVAHASAIRQALEQKATRRYVDPSALACAALGVGDLAAAITWLERGLEQRCMWLPFVAVDLRLAPLRGNARFEAIAAAARGEGEAAVVPLARGRRGRGRAAVTNARR